VLDTARCDDVARSIAEAAGHLDILVNNAGIGHVGTMENTTGEDMDRVYAVNVRGVFNVTKAFFPSMLARKHGVIVNIASIGGLFAVRDRLAYTVSKHAVVGLTRAMAIDHARDEDIRSIFELNFFARDALTRAALPGLRAQRRGHIVNISSTGGLVGRAGSGFYAATKFAMEGYSEALAQELAPHGVGVTVVEPGSFRTRFADALLQGSVQDYEETAGARLQAVLSNTGLQPGDPERGARLIYEAVTCPSPPLHLPLGAGTVGVFRDKAKALMRDFETWEAGAAATEHPTHEPQGNKP
jgi:NAD(P)-dependent dehydrogenase (short-subunit alcohol dehydrogenase family)